MHLKLYNFVVLPETSEWIITKYCKKQIKRQAIESGTPLKQRVTHIVIHVSSVFGIYEVPKCGVPVRPIMLEHSLIHAAMLNASLLRTTENTLTWHRQELRDRLASLVIHFMCTSKQYNVKMSTKSAWCTSHSLLYNYCSVRTVVWVVQVMFRRTRSPIGAVHNKQTTHSLFRADDYRLTLDRLLDNILTRSLSAWCCGYAPTNHNTARLQLGRWLVAG